MKCDASDSTITVAESTPASLFTRIWALGLGVLLLATFPLWFFMPGMGANSPPVSWIDLPRSLLAVAGIQYTSLAVLVFALGAAIVNGRRRWIWWPVMISLAVLVLMDQHRLQPWAYQSMLYAAIFGSMAWREGRKWIIAIAISIYFYSAAGKLDYQFIHTVGNQMVQTMARPLGGVSDQWATKISLVLPISELTIAFLLAVPKTRRLGGFCAISMHLTLIGLLGPLSLGHSWGVLAWNALLAAQSWVLFCRRPLADDSAKDSADSSDLPRGATYSAWPVRLVVIIALLAPMTERYGSWDHWTSWALYSPHNSRVEIQIHSTVVDRLPVQIQHYLGDDADGDRWSDLDIKAWSLEQRLVPIYPQARYGIALALELAQQHDLGQAIRVKARSVSDRWTGARHETFLIGQSELERELQKYWLRDH